MYVLQGSASADRVQLRVRSVPDFTFGDALFLKAPKLPVDVQLRPLLPSEGFDGRPPARSARALIAFVDGRPWARAIVPLPPRVGAKPYGAVTLGLKILGRIDPRHGEFWTRFRRGDPAAVRLARRVLSGELPADPTPP
jgi:hypothetical protein